MTTCTITKHEEYSWAEGCKLSRLDPQQVGETFSSLAAKHNGMLTQEAVVRAARPKRSPLHSAFEWDDAQAAHAHRLSQAGHLIRSLVVVCKTPCGAPARPSRALVNTIDGGERGFVSIARVLSDAQLRAQHLAACKKDWAVFRRRYKHLVELASLFEAVDETLDKL